MNNNLAMKKLVYATILLSVIAMVGINANLPAYADLAGISTKTIGIIVSLNPLTCLFFSVPFAYLSDKYNRFIVIFLGLLFYVFAALLLVIDKTIVSLVFVKILEGLAIAAFLPAVIAFITDISKKENLTQAIGSFTSVFNLGFLIAPIFAAALGKFVGLESIFIFVFICTLLNLLLCIPIYKLYKRDYSKKPIIENGNGIVKPLKSDFKSFKWVVLISLSLLSFALGYAMGLFDSIWAYYIRDLGGDIFTINLTYFCYAVPVALLSKYMGTMADKYSNLHLPIMLGSAIISISILSYGFIPFPLLIAFVCCFEGAGNAAMYPAANAVMVKSVDEYFKGRSLGIFNSARMAGNFIGAIVTGYLFTIMHILPFIVNATFIFIAAIIATVCIVKYKVK